MADCIVNHQGALAYDLLRASLLSLAVQVPGQERRDHRATPPKDLALYICECVAAMDDECVKRGWVRPIRYYVASATTPAQRRVADSGILTPACSSPISLGRRPC